MDDKLACRRDPGRDSSDIRRLQPYPLQTLSISIDVGGVPVSAISRAWSPGDTHRCRLCNRCTADHDNNICLIVAKRPVARSEAALFEAKNIVPAPPEPGPRLARS